MTKIPSVEEVVYNFGKQFDELKMKPPKNSMPGLERELIKDFMRKALTAERTALLTELREWAEVNKSIFRAKENGERGVKHYSKWSQNIKTLESLQAHLDGLIKSNNV